MSADAVRSLQPSAGNSACATPKSKLDSLPREDLIRFVKKQLDYLGKARKEVASLKGIREDLSDELIEAQKAREVDIEALEEEHKKERESNYREIERLRTEIVSLKECGNERHESSPADSTELEALKNEMEFLKSELDMEREKHHNVEQDEQQLSENLRLELQQVKNMFHDQTESLQKAEKEKYAMQLELSEIRSKLEDADEKLVLIKEKHSAVSVLSLEMADYEKSIDLMKKELKDTKSSLEERESKVHELQGKLEMLEGEKAKVGTTNSKLKAVIVKLKKQSEERKESAERLEKDSADGEQRFEQKRIEWEQERVRLSRTLGEQEERIRQFEQMNLSMQSQIGTLRNQREQLQRQYDDIIMEYDSFKLKARYVLEQQKTATPADSFSQSDYATLKTQLDVQVQTNSSLSERCQSLDREICIAREKVFSLNADFESQKRIFAEKLAQAESKQKELMMESEARVSSLTNQNRNLVIDMDDKALALREKDRQIRELNKEIVLAQQESKRMCCELDAERRRREEEELKMTQQDPSNPKSKPVANDSRARSDLELVRRVNRELLEKPMLMRFEDSLNEENAILVEGNDRPLEDLLFGEDIEQLTNQLVSSQSSSFSHVADVEQLQVQLSHSADLLKETEENNVLLVEQIKVLKEEVRRLERNVDRASHLENTEYLKNVVMKFLTPEKVNDERPQLIPVLSTMLKLNQEEVNALQKCSQGDDADAQDTSSSLLGSYIHRWTGFS